MFSLRWLFVLMFFWLACDLPFSTKPSAEEDLFLVTHDYDGHVIHEKTAITISWSDITIEDFKEYRIEKAKIIAGDYYWVDLAHLPDSLTTSYVDTLDDDGTFQYRVRIVDQRDQYRHELSEEFVVPNISSLYIPDHYVHLETAYYTKFIDNGDSIVFRPGFYPGNHDLLGKDVLITSTHGPIITILIGITTQQSVISIDRGRLDGLGIQNGTGFSGGGVWAGGTAVVANCFIKNNLAVEDPTANMQIYPSGHGGGVFITDTALVTDCKIVNNRARRGGGGVALDKFAMLQNSIVFANSNLSAPLSEPPYSGGGVFISDHSFGVVVRNCRFTRNRTLGIGGGVCVDGNTTIGNCIFNYNIARVGGGGFALAAGNSIDLVNCTFYRNSASQNDHYSIISFGDLNILNCIISRGILVDRVNNKFYSINSTYSLIQEVTVVGGTGNIVANPLFVDPENSDFRLEAESPAINAGHPGNEYKDSNGSRNDMGAFGGPYGDDWE